MTTVGSAGPMSASYYGTYDQTGNAQEFLETFPLGSSDRYRRGGSFDSGQALDVSSAFHLMTNAATTSNQTGFRVATMVPEPATFLLLSLAAVGVLALGSPRDSRLRRSSRGLRFAKT